MNSFEKPFAILFRPDGQDDDPIPFDSIIDSKISAPEPVERRFKSHKLLKTRLAQGNRIELEIGLDILGYLKCLLRI